MCNSCCAWNAAKNLFIKLKIPISWDGCVQSDQIQWFRRIFGTLYDRIILEGCLGANNAIRFL